MRIVLIILFVLSYVHGQFFESEEDSRILIIGESTLGRFELGRVLLGKNSSERSEHDKCSSSPFKTCVDEGSWFGEKSLNITIFNTPRYPHKYRDRQVMINEFLHTLKEEIKSINIFIITFGEWAMDISFGSRMILSSLHNKFGDKFWEHAILLAPDWRYSQELRTEESWTSAINKELKNAFKIQNELPSIFLDCTDKNKTKSQIENFENQAKSLLNFIQSKSKQFIFEDVAMALHEVETLNRRIEILIDSNEERHYMIADLTEQMKKPENFKIVYITSVICGGCIILGVIITLIMVCISYLKDSTRRYDCEDTQSSGHSEVHVLGECLTYCGYSREEIERMQSVISNNQNL